MPAEAQSQSRRISKREAAIQLRNLRLLVTALESFDAHQIRGVFRLTQDQMASLASLPVRTITRWEQQDKDKRMQPRLESLRKLCEGLEEKLKDAD